MRSLCSSDIGCFPFSASGGDQHEDDFQPGYGHRYFSGFLLLDHFCRESLVYAGLSAAEILTAAKFTCPGSLLRLPKVPISCHIASGLATLAVPRTNSYHAVTIY